MTGWYFCQRLSESLDGEPDAEWEQAWAEEAQRRLEEVRAGKVKTIPGDEALAEVRRSLGR